MNLRLKNPRPLKYMLLALAILIVLLTARSAAACAVCFGSPDAAMTVGINKGILVLLGVVAAVQIFFVAVFFSIRQRTRRLEQSKSRFQVLQGGAN
jgi:hypothetical protein